MQPFGRIAACGVLLSISSGCGVLSETRRLRHPMGFPPALCDALREEAIARGHTLRSSLGASPQRLACAVIETGERESLHLMLGEPAETDSWALLEVQARVRVPPDDEPSAGGGDEVAHLLAEGLQLVLAASERYAAGVGDPVYGHLARDVLTPRPVRREQTAPPAPAAPAEPPTSAAPIAAPSPPVPAEPAAVAVAPGPSPPVPSTQPAQPPSPPAETRPIVPVNSGIEGGQAIESEPSPVPSSIPPVAVPRMEPVQRVRWYGGWLIPAYLLSPIVAVGINYAADDWASPWALLGFTLPAVVHLAHANPGRSAVSAAGLAGSVWAGAAVGRSFYSNCTDTLCEVRGMATGVLVGYLGWALLDMVFLPYQTTELQAQADPLAPRVGFAIAPRQQGAFGTVIIDF